MAALTLAGAPAGGRVLIAGLGFGFTLAETLEHDVGEVVLVELEGHVVAWNKEWWPLGHAALADPRVRLVVDDFGAFVQRVDDLFDVTLVDIDNGPEWTVATPNDDLYDELLPHLRRVVKEPGGRLCVWSASASAAFERRLAEHFAEVTVHEVPVPRGEPDVLYLART
jgi:spermidine synthase